MIWGGGFGEGGESIRIYINVSESEGRNRAKRKQTRKADRLIRGVTVNIFIISHDKGQ